jgi:DmsE family decaheme c-type cytochrome
VQTNTRLKLGVLAAFVVGAAAVLAGPRAAAALADAARQDGDYVGPAKCAECHTDKFAQFRTTPHYALVTDEHTADRDRGCEACHGPGALHSQTSKPEDIFNPRLATAEQVAARCTRCHSEQSIERQPFHNEHDLRAVGCNDCHSPHQEKTLPYLLIKDAPGLCLTCHREVGADFRKPFHHRVLEGGMSCLECHSAHNRNNTAEARQSDEGLSGLCARCHADKRGPFVFEHLGLTRSEEGCVTCHNPHGSVNNRLLQRASVFQTCVQCHSEIGLTADPASGGDFTHDLSDPRIQNCTVCHVQIHGSNTHPRFLQ